jgi:RimJ/RimL family protein N-acetyltransferase/nitrite reductase/ring-hydroxylating ferredoxin subunit
MASPLQPPDPPLSDGVVTLRPLRAEDAPTIAAACQDPAIARWIPLIPVPYEEADARRFILMTLQAWKDGTGYEFGIADATTGAWVGSVGIHVGQNPRRHAVGYLVAPEHRRRGIATRALRLATGWAFENLSVQRLALWTLPGNVASQAVAEKAGFRFEGLTRNWEAGRDERPVDAVMFAMTPEDYGEAVAAAAELATVEAGGPPVARFPRELTAPGTRAAAFVDLAATAALPPASMTRVTLAGIDLVVIHTPNGLVVTGDRCPHMSAPLSLGELEGCIVACPLHDARFDLSTGEVVEMPTTGGLDPDGTYHGPRLPPGVDARPEPPSKRAEARHFTRTNRLRYYPARVRGGRLEAQVPVVPE